MALRILHTSDWHLGASLEGVSRHEEHAAFLGWLRRVLVERNVDLLVVTGDVFDGPQPAADSQRLYFDFLADLGSSPVRKTVIVGGNHDSPSRLAAPSEVLRSLGVHVVGGYDTRHPEELLCPVPAADGAVEAVVLAVPFVHEMRLGISTTAADAATVHAELSAKLGELYSNLADLAEQKFGPVPLIATGHLTAVGAERGDYPYEVHQVGTLGALPATIFDERLRYVALGHVHRRYRVGESRAYYAGSPLPVGPAEASREHGVLLFDLDAREPEFVAAPLARALVSLAGDEAELVAGLARLTWTEALPPFVYLELVVDRFDSNALARFEERLAPGAARIVSLRQRTTEVGPSGVVPRTLDELEPEAVFRLLCDREGVSVDDELVSEFRDALDEARGGAEARGT
jgi:exonuclease SbcD